MSTFFLSSTHRVSSTVTRVLVRWTESSLMVTATWLMVELPWSSSLLRCTENSWKVLRQSDTRLYSHVPGNWNTSPSKVLKCWLPQVLQMLLTWFRTGEEMDRIEICKVEQKNWFWKLSNSLNFLPSRAWTSMRGNRRKHNHTLLNPMAAMAVSPTASSVRLLFMNLYRAADFPFPPPNLPP